MTYSIVREIINKTGRVVIYDILDDDSNLVIGGLTENFNASATDADIDSRLTMLVKNITLSTIPGDETAFELLRKRHELKSLVLNTLMINPSITLTEIKTNLSWDDQNLIDTLVRMYAFGLYNRGLIGEPIDTPEGCFDSLKTFVQNTPDYILYTMLQDEEFK